MSRPADVDDQRIQFRLHDSATSINLQSRKSLTSWDTLFRHDASELKRRRETHVDSNPYTPKELTVLADIPERYRGRNWGKGAQPFNVRAITQSCRCTAGCCFAKQRDRVTVGTPSRTQGVQSATSKIKASRAAKAQTPKDVAILSFVKIHERRVIDRKRLSSTTRCARLELRRMIADHRLVSSSGGARVDLGMSTTSSLLSTSRSVTGGVGIIGLTRSSASQSPRSSTPLPRMSPSQASGEQRKWPVIEVFFEGEEAPVLVLRDCVNPLDSIASLRSKIDREFRDMVGGASLADETNWTFSSFHPPVVVWLSSLLHDFKTYYSDTEHSRYTGTQAKEIKAMVARHREQAENLEKFLCIVRLSLESCASVVQLCPRITMKESVYRQKGLPGQQFFRGLQPQLPPMPPVPSLAETRCFLAPVMGAIRAQIDRMAASGATGTKVPPPVECGIPMFAGSATRVGYRLVNMARRRTAMRQYALDMITGSLEDSNIVNGVLELAVPRITLKKVNPSLAWERSEVMMSQVEEICRGGRGLDHHEDDAAGSLDMDVHASEADAMEILLGGASKGISSPILRSRSPVSPTAAEKRRSVSPTQRTGLSPTQSSNGASSSFGIHVMSAEEELQRNLEEGITPLYRCDGLGWSYLDYAFWFRRPSIVKLLCDFGANPSNQDCTNGDTVLHRFIKARSRTVKDIQSLQVILEHCSVRHLLSLLRVKNFQGLTPLSLAIRLRDFVVVQAIITCVASPRCRATMSAARYPSSEEESLMCRVFTFDCFVDECSLPHLLWVENNCFLDPANAVGEVLGASLLHRAMMAPPFSVRSEEARDNVVAMMLTRVDPLTRDTSERTAFHCAARCHGCSKWLVPFLDHMQSRAGSVSAASVASVHKLFGRNPSMANHPAMISSGKAVSQSVDAEGNTVLHTALLWCRNQSALSSDVYAFAAHPHVLPYLQLDKQNRNGDTILHLVMRRRQLALAELLCRSLKYESAGSVQRLLTVRNGDGDTMVGCAIKAQFPDGLRILLSIESIAEIVLTAVNSDDRLPLLLAVDVLGAQQAMGTQFAVMDQRPHCTAREENDCLYIMLRLARDHRLLHDMIHCVSGSRRETALHGAARHMLWHQCSLLMSFGASPNRLDGAGRTVLQITFEHPHDTSLPRLMIANDTSEWKTGNTLMCCLAARGAASCSSVFMNDCFFNRYPFPWADDAAFSAPFLDIAFETGNLFVIERLLCLGARPLQSRGEELFAQLLKKYLVAITYDRGSRWKRMENFMLHTTSPLRAAALAEVVEGLLVTMCEDEATVPHVRPSFLAQAVHANFPALAVSLMKRLRLQFGADIPCSVQPVVGERGVVTCAAIELVGAQWYSQWPLSTRKEVLMMDAAALLRCNELIGLSAWQQAIARAAMMSNLEALTILIVAGRVRVATCARNEEGGRHVTVEYVHRASLDACAALPLAPFRKIPASQAPLFIECMWLSRRYALAPPLIIALMMVEDQVSAIEEILLHCSPAWLAAVLLVPIPVDRNCVAALGRRRVLRWARQENVSVCVLAMSVSGVNRLTDAHRVVLAALRKALSELMSTTDGTFDVVNALRDVVLTALDDGSWATLKTLLSECVLPLDLPAQSAILQQRDDHAGLFGGAFVRLVCSPHPLVVDALQWLVPILANLAPPQQPFSSDVVDRVFKAVQEVAQACASSAPEEDKVKDRDGNTRRGLQLVLRDVLVLYLMGGISTILPPQRVSTNRPRHQSITALEQLQLNTLQDSFVASVVHVLQEVSATHPSSVQANLLGSHLSVRHLEVMVQHRLVLSLAYIHCITTTSNGAPSISRGHPFPNLDGVLSHVDSRDSRGDARLSYLSRLIIDKESSSSAQTHPLIPDVIVHAVTESCRSEYSYWRQHTSWWVDHILDVHHPTTIRRIPIQTRRAFPILSLMRDIARSEPTTARGVWPSPHMKKRRRYDGATPLHCAAINNREAVVVHMLQESSRELDVNALDAMGRTALIWAAKLGHHSIASQLVSTGVDILAEDVHGLGCLAYASDANMVELILADDDGEEAANSRSSKPHRSSPLMHHVRCGRSDAAMALLQSVVCNNCTLDDMIDGVSGETLLHLAAARRELHDTVLPALLERVPVPYVLQVDAQGWTARDYSAPRSTADVLLERRGVARTVRLWPEGKYTIGLRDHRALRHSLSQLLGTSGHAPEAWKKILGFHVRRSTESTMTIDESSWELASQGRDREVLALLEKGHRDMQMVRMYGIPAPRSENDKRSVAKDVNLLLQMRFGGCRGGCRLMFPSAEATKEISTGDDITAHPFLSTEADDATTDELPLIVPGSRLPSGIDPSAPYAAALMIDETRIPVLLSTTGLSIKNRPLKVIREPPRGPQYRSNIQPHTSSLLHQICRTGCLRSLSYVLRNNASQGSPNELICHLLSSTYDEDGMTPFHVAVLHRQWGVVVELLKNRIPFGVSAQRNVESGKGTQGDALHVSPQQVFASMVQLLSFHWIAGAGNVPSTAQPLSEALALSSPHRGRKHGCSHFQLFSRFSNVDAEAVAYALIRAAADSMLLGRMQRIVLTSILDTSSTKACIHVMATFAEKLEKAIVQSPRLAADHGNSNDQFVLRKLLGRIKEGGLQLVVDHEGADARDSALERERTKALLMYHLEGGVLYRVLEAALFDYFMMAGDLADDAHPSLRVYRWVSLLHVDSIRFMCCKKSELPRVSITPSTSLRGCFTVELSFSVDAHHQLRCPDLTATLRDFFCTSLLDAAWALQCAIEGHGVHVSILDQEVLLMRRFMNAVTARCYLEDQQQQQADNGTVELVDAAEVCWSHIRKSFEDSASSCESVGDQPTVDNRSMTSTGAAMAVASVQVEHLNRFLQLLRLLLVHDIIPQIMPTPGEVNLAGGRHIVLPSGCNEVTLVLHKQVCRSADASAVDELHHQSDARVATFGGLAMLRRNWQGHDEDQKCNAPQTRTKRSQPGPSAVGLQHLHQARRVVAGERHVLVVCPLQETIDDIESGTTLLTVPFAACEMYRSSEWAGRNVTRFTWRSSSSMTNTAIASASSSGRPPSRPSNTVSAPISPPQVECRPPSAVSLNDISTLVDPTNVARLRGGALPRCVQRVDIPPTINGLVEALQSHGGEVDVLFEHLSKSSAEVKSTTAACRLATVLPWVAPYLVDPLFVWTKLRLVNRQSHSVVMDLARRRELFPLKPIIDRLRHVCSLLEDAGNTHPRMSPRSGAAVIDILAAAYLLRRGDSQPVLGDHLSLASGIFNAFCRNPIQWFHHVASIRGAGEASRLPPWLLRRCHRVQHSRKGGRAPSDTLSRVTPPYVLELSFGVLYRALAALWALHNTLRAADTHKDSRRTPSSQEDTLL